ncbi:hypothetical protein AWB85_12030 [Mycobacteroides immunogenum]|uniref:Cupin type-2 domain-containing protein n=1 Tax=Mycobacteroides immunogenum TaxID=83262 RepID=A0A179V7X3_9MYCO|nr:cupin domain-containing protein [Mycobacteroides immunogenum]OAT67844.1 hypothetical protein AWB85_12030 [Mycobacteroides immunogenum]
MFIRIVLSLLLAALAPIPIASAQPEKRTPTVTVVSSREISNIPGKSFVIVRVDFPPGAVSPPHRHAGSAFIQAFVESGTLRNEVEGDGVRDYSAGQYWYEEPGAHHLRTENLSRSAPAVLFADIIMDTGDEPLTIYDEPGQ